MMSRLITVVLFSAGVVAASTFGVAQSPAYASYPSYQGPAVNSPAYDASQGNPGTANPGAVNYVEGSAFLDGTTLNRRDVGRAYLEPGEVLSTTTGKAEVLLTPGVFLRLDDNSAVKMISPDLTRTQVEVEKGRAAVEVDQIFPQNDLEMTDAGVSTRLLKPGLYEFNANQPAAMVFQGKAVVNEGDGRSKEIKDHHETALVANASLKSVSFDTHDAQDQFYNWSSLRSQYLSEANGQIADQYAGVAGFNSGWYWDPYMWDYTFVGIGPYWSPFGFGFFPPWGWYSGYWRGGYFGGHFYGGGYRAGGRGGGFAASRGYAVSGFHGGGGFAGGGGFHGGGGGGRR
jgi:peroxiredoxin